MIFVWINRWVRKYVNGYFAFVRMDKTTSNITIFFMLVFYEILLWLLHSGMVIETKLVYK